MPAHKGTGKTGSKTSVSPDKGKSDPKQTTPKNSADEKFAKKADELNVDPAKRDKDNIAISPQQPSDNTYKQGQNNMPDLEAQSREPTPNPTAGDMEGDTSAPYSDGRGHKA